MARLLLDKITKTYPGNILALNQFALEIQDGEFVVLLGPSGSGKSTLLRVVSGLEEIHHGKIILGDRDVTQLSPKDRDVAMVFQNNALYPHMSVYDNIAFPLRLRKLSSQEIDERTRETAATLGIEALLSRKPRTLSGGERQRAALGKAIVRRPKVFLLDEPLSSLDARLRLQMREEIKSLQRKLKITVLYVTHDQEEAMCLGDRLVLLDHGSIQQVGRPAELYDYPANRFVATFLGAPAINLLTGHVAHDQNGSYFDLGYSKLHLPARHSEQLTKHLGSRRGQNLVLGIRPENIGVRNSKENAPPQNCLDVKAMFAEVLGSKKLLYLLTPRGERLVGNLDSDSPIVEGQSIKICLDLAQAHIFASGDEGCNLTLP